MSLVFNMVGGGNGSGGILTVNAPAGVTVTVTNDEKTYTRIASADGVAVFKGLATGTWYVSIDDADHDPTAPVAVEINADYTITLAFFAATINITYPAGSTCTATDSVSTFTAPDTSGTWVLVVPNVGTWTISATDGTDTTSRTVEISAEGQSLDVELSYKLYLFKSGEGAKVALSTFKEDSQCYVTIGTDYISMGWQSNNRVTSFSTEEKIDLTNYSVLAIEYTCSDPGSGNYYEAFGISSVAARGGDTPSILNTARKTITYSSSRKSDTLDISGNNGEYYVGVCGAGKSDTYNLWLLP